MVDEKDYLLELGIKEVISIEEADDKSGRPLLKPRWAGAIDTVAGNILATAIKTTKYGGTVTCCGNVGSAELTSSIYPFILNGVSLLGIDSVNCPWTCGCRCGTKLPQIGNWITWKQSPPNWSRWNHSMHELV